MKWWSVMIALLILQVVGSNLVVSPDSGQPGTQFVVSGSGFEAGGRVKVSWDGVNLAGTAKVGPDGTFRYSAAVPDGALAGAHDVEGQSVGSGTASAKTTFFVIVPSPTTTTPTSTTPTTSPATTSPSTSTVTTAAKTRSTTAPSESVGTGVGSGTTVADSIAGDVPQADETAGVGGPISTRAQEDTGGPRRGEPVDSAEPNGLGVLLVALAVVSVVAGTAFMLWTRSRDDEDELVVNPSPIGSEEPQPIVAPVDANGREGEWVRRGMELTPQGHFEGVIGTAFGLIASGQTTESEGAGEATIWSSADGIDWERAATLGNGNAHLTLPWREGLFVVVPQEQGSRINTTCWWSDDNTNWEQLTHDADDSLQGVIFEGGTAGEDSIVVWGRGLGGPGVWSSRDGGKWNRSDIVGGIDLITWIDNRFLAFGRQPDQGRPVIASSPDGLTWEEVPVEPKSVFEGAFVAALSRFDGGIVAAGGDIMRGKAAVWVSDEGRRWLRAPFEPATGTAIEHLAATDGRLLAVGGDTGKGRRGHGTVAVWESTNAVSWERVPASELFANAIAKSVVCVDRSPVIYGALFESRRGQPTVSLPVIWERTSEHSLESGLDEELDAGTTDPPLVKSSPEHITAASRST